MPNKSLAIRKPKGVYQAPPKISVQYLIEDSEKWAVITNLVDEALNCKKKIEHERENLKALRDAAHDAGLQPNLFNAYLAAVFNNDYDKRLEDVEQQETLLRRIMTEAAEVEQVNLKLIKPDV